MSTQRHASRSAGTSSNLRCAWRGIVRSNSRSLATSLCGLGCIVLAVAMSVGCGNKNVSAAAAPPPKVQVTDVIQRDVPIYHEYLATLDGFVNAQIQPQVSGYLIKQNYLEGAVVSRNQVLFKIDPRPFQAIVDQAVAQVAQA
jgi:multidrug efflux pump subunit AcrA (membrane-fusion protein)